jgi:hypothetical protein
MLGVTAAAVFSVIGLAIFGPIIFLLYRRLRDLKRLANNAFRPRENNGPGGRSERTTIRLGVATIWTNVMALVLISMVGFAQFSLEFWRGEKSYMLAPALEELLRTRLPDQEMQQRQHQEIIDAIRSLTAPTAAPTPADDGATQTELLRLKNHIENLENARRQSSAILQDFGIIAWVMIGCLILIGVFLLYRAIFLEGSWIKKTIEGLVALILIVAPTVGGAKLGNEFKGEFSLIKSIEKLNFDFGWRYSPSEPPPIPESQRFDVHLHFDARLGSMESPSLTNMDCGEGDTQRVTPFKDGTATLDPAGQQKLESVVAILEKNKASRRLMALMLMGSADKRPLKPKTVELYSTNDGLAQARIKVVRDRLRSAFPEDNLQVLEVYTGPAQTGAAVTAEGLATDRAVRVCAFWNGKP